MRTYPVQNLGRPRLWMGQAPAAAPNRLDELPVDVILGRGWLFWFKEDVPQTDVRDSLAAIDRMNAPGSPFKSQYPGPREWTPGQYEALAAMRKNLTDPEKKDLALIDGFFILPEGGFTLQGDWKKTSCDNPRALHDWIVRYRTNPRVQKLPDSPVLLNSKVESQELEKNLANGFFCEEVEKIPFISARNQSWMSGSFGIDTSLPWAQVRQTLRNAAAFSRVAKAYPYPSPVPYDWPQVYYFVAKDLVDLVHQPYDLPEFYIRFWITMAVVAHFDEIVRGIESDMKRAARRARMDALTEKIVLAVALTLLTAGIGSAIGAAVGVSAAVATSAATAVTSGISTAITIQDRKEAARGMTEIANLFRDSDAGFAGQVDDAARILDAQTAAEPVTESAAVAAFRAEQKGVAAATKPTTPGEYLVGGVTLGGVAFAIALAVLRR